MTLTVTKPLVLTGMMGSGKSAAGRLLARKTGRPFTDSDAEIEMKTGITIPAVFARDGEPAFRQMEKEAIAHALQNPRIILATGGGAVMDADTRLHLRQNAFCIYLQAAPQTLFDRVKGDTNRPLLQTPDPLETLTRLLADREPFYRMADLTIPTDGKTPQETADAILEQLQKIL
jgi:shikimate kinase